ncbi:AAA family ATPase [Actinoplanes sp. DH11]|uniref:AAA family ATPase n=1 Tax=Actinoplanes sp. DH11 TaxID=2857011 RepID=UPI001E47C75C|nr:hypothetical protein [Actinoplanes sp. DH11]
MSGGRGRLRALTIGIERFGAGEEGDRALPFAGARAGEVADALGAFGYEPLDAGVAADATGNAVGELVERAYAGLGSEDLLVVHVVSHGYLDAGGFLCVLGPDGAETGFNTVDGLMRRVDSDPGVPRTLFLLDLCHAGSVPRAAWQVQALAQRRAWVIAACEANRLAYGGRFSRAVAGVLRTLSAGGLDIGPATPFIPLPTVAREIRRALISLATSENGMPQQVTSSLVDMADDPLDLPFFPNPGFVRAPIVQARPRVDSGVEPFVADVDEALDAGHFMTRASGYGGAAAGCFSGREDELRALSDWFDGADQGRLRVVTGGPGSGKSALVGVLVCAAHPKLSTATEPVWRHVQRVPRVNGRFAAVHVRHRTVDDVVASLVAQLELDTSAPLPAQLAQHTGEPPLVVIDALDEAENPAALVSRLLLPLAITDRADGRPVCRLLVATRPWEEFAELLGRAAVIDLDQVPAERLGRELDLYVSRLLYAFDPYGKIEYAAVRATFAQGVAEALARAEPRPPGAFLVAGMYAHHLVTAYRPIDETAKVWEIARRVPRTLEDLLELDLAARTGTPWLRPILAALAHARGAGMPASLAGAAARAFAPGTAGPSAAEISEVVDTAGRFYLRQATDVDGTSLYRLFHQGLADHLRQQPGPGAPAAADVAGAVFRAMLGRLDPGGWGVRRWDLAEPYLRRHAVQHAQDAGVVGELLGDTEFLVAVEWAQLDEVRNGWLRQVEDAVPPGEDRRTQLAIAASIAGETGLRERLSRRPDGQGLPWSPAWSAQRGGVPVSAMAQSSSGTAAVAYRDGRVDVLSRATGEVLLTITTPSEARYLRIGAVAGQRVLITEFAGSAVLYDGVSGQELASAPRPADNHERRELRGRWGVRLTELLERDANSAPAVVRGELVEVFCTPAGIHVGRVGPPESRGRVWCVTVDGVPHAVRLSFEADRVVSVWNLESRSVIRTVTLPEGRQGMLACTDGDLLIRTEAAVTCLRAAPPPTIEPARPARVVPTPTASPAERPFPAGTGVDQVLGDFAGDAVIRRHLGSDPVPGHTPALRWRAFHLGLLRLPADLATAWRRRMEYEFPAGWTVPGDDWIRLPAKAATAQVLIPAFHGEPGVAAVNYAPAAAVVIDALGDRLAKYPRLATIGTQVLWLAAVDPTALVADFDALVPAPAGRELIRSLIHNRLAAFQQSVDTPGRTTVERAVELADALRSVLHLPPVAADSWWAGVLDETTTFVRHIAATASDLWADDLARAASHQELVKAGETVQQYDIGVPVDDPADVGAVLHCLRPSLRAGDGTVHRPGRVVYGRAR